MTSRSSWLLLVAAGLAGAAGVTLSALAAHKAQDPMLASAANILMIHAAAIAAIAVAAGQTSRPFGFIAGGALLFLGSALFGATIAMLVFTGNRPFPMSAPIGGSTMIVGWLVLAASALVAWFGSRRRA